MDLLEDVVRFSESHMGEPLPTNFGLLLFPDSVIPDAEGHNTGINMTVHPSFDVDDRSEDALNAPLLLAHEVAHYYWGGSGEAWIDEGAADVMSFAYDESTTGYEWYVSDIATMYPCSIPDLSTLALMPEDPPRTAFTDLGQASSWSYIARWALRTSGRASGLPYLLGQNDPGPDGPGARRIHVREAFEFHPAARDDEIPRWVRGPAVGYSYSRSDSFCRCSSIAASLGWFGASSNTFSKSWIALPYLVMDSAPE